MRNAALTFLVASLAALGCAAGCRSSAPAAPETPPAEAPPTTVPDVKPAANLAGGSCSADSDCTAPAKCITVVGMRPESKREECWVSCPTSGSADGCPGGMVCTMIHDGPGQVCVGKSAD